MIDHHVSSMSHLIIICCPEPEAVFICNERVLEYWIFIWCICATELWMSQTPERPGHRGIPLKLKPLSLRESRARVIICSLRVWAPRLHTVYQQINLSRLTRCIDCRADEEQVDWMWMWVREGEWIKRVEALSEKETLVALTARQERERERDVQKEMEGNWHEQSWQPAISFSVKQRAC